MINKKGEDTFCALTEYMNYVCGKPLLRLRPPENGIFTNKSGIEDGHISSVILDRHGQFQTELFILSDQIRDVEAHEHPGVDSIELSVSGEFIFKTKDHELPFEAKGQRIGDNISIMILEDAGHGAVAKRGASFLSFQHWKKSDPTSIGHTFKIVTLRGKENGRSSSSGYATTSSGGSGVTATVSGRNDCAAGSSGPARMGKLF